MIYSLFSKTASILKVDIPTRVHLGSALKSATELDAPISCKHFFGRKFNFEYCIVASTSPSHIEAHAGLFRSLMKGIFDPYVLTLLFQNILT